MDKKTRRQIITGITENFNKKKVLVIGDLILDEFVYGRAIGLSLETPTLKAEHTKTEYSYGGAGNVVKNILELGANLSFITLLGNNGYSGLNQEKHFEYHISQKNKESKFLPIIEEGRETTVKRRFWVERGGVYYKVFQLDHLDNREITEKTREKILEKTEEEIKDSDLVLLVDYRHGMLTKRLIEDLKTLSIQERKKIIASSQLSQKQSNHADYHGVHLMCMNLNEAKSLDSKFSPEKTRNLLETILGSSVCITLGANGAVIYLKGNKYSSSGIKVEEKDSCGAGDCFLGALALTDFEKYPEESLYIANCWAGLSVRETGTTTPKKQELIDYLTKEAENE
ncbi:MAG: PfkB family carbohydrate kinase [Nanoarchaeota archaeon]